MRVIEKEMLNAIGERKNWKKDNTQVRVYDNQSDLEVYLHGNLICKIKKHTKELYLYDGGWQSSTTKSRLNAILRKSHNGSIFQKAYVWYFTNNISTYDFELINTLGLHYMY